MKARTLLSVAVGLALSSGPAVAGADASTDAVTAATNSSASSAPITIGEVQTARRN